MIQDSSPEVPALDYYRAAHRNPLIDALPDLDFGPKILDRISFAPPVPDATVRAEPAKVRLRFVGELVRIHVALNRDRELAQSIDSMIREGLLSRGSVAQQRAVAYGQTELLVRATNESLTQESALAALLTRASRVHTPAEMRNARRLLGRPWMNFAERSKEWDRLVSTLWLYQFTSEFVPLDAELRRVIYHETVGLPGLTVKLLRETQRVLILANLAASEEREKMPERITTNLLTAVAKAIFGPVRPMLAALRSGRLEDIACFEDLTLDDKLVDARITELAEFRRREFQRTIRAIRNEGTRQRRRVKISLRQDVDELLGGIKPAEGQAVIPAVPDTDAARCEHKSFTDTGSPSNSGLRHNEQEDANQPRVTT